MLVARFNIHNVYSQCIHKKIEENGLSPEYSSNEVYQNVWRKLFKLLFLPPIVIVRGFQNYDNQLQTIFLTQVLSLFTQLYQELVDFQQLTPKTSGMFSTDLCHYLYN